MTNGDSSSSVRAILFAFLANLGIALAKLAAAIYTGSGSMWAEAIHSFADCGNQVLLYLGLRQAERPADSEHPLGYGKLTFFSMGGVFSIYEGWHRLRGSGELHAAWIALSVLGVSFVLECGSLLGCLREIRALRGENSLLSWLRTTRNGELVVVLGEDCAALIGLALAFLFIELALLTGDSRFDAIGSISVGAVLIVIALFVASRIKSLLIGRSAEPELVRRIDAILATRPAIERVFNVVTLQHGAKVMLAAKIKIRSGIDIDAAVAHINELERELKRQMPELGWCFIEPDNSD
jgi:cation diffusion facilitator family transporter